MDLTSRDEAREVVVSDEAFFNALLDADVDTLRDVLADDFLIVDVMSGNVTAGADLLGAIASGDLRFVEVTRFAEDSSVRLRESLAVVVGRTRMAISYLGQDVTTSSRYTHVFSRERGRWRLLSAQGTPITD